MHILAGIYEVIDIQLKDNDCIYGDGQDQTILVGKEGFTGKSIISNREDGTQDDPTENVFIHDLELDGSNMGGGSYSTENKGITGAFFKDLTIENVYCHDTPATCIGTDFLDNGYISSVLVERAGSDDYTSGSNGIGIGTGGLPGEYVVITNSITKDTANAGIMLEEYYDIDTDSNYIVSNNLSENDKFGPTASGTSNVLFYDNDVIDSDSSAIRAIRHASHTPENISIIRNNIEGAGDIGIIIACYTLNFTIDTNTISDSGSYAVLLRGSNGQMTHNVIDNSGGRGISIAPNGAAGWTPHDIQIQYNEITDSGQLTTNGDAINLNSSKSPIHDVYIIGNTIYDTQTIKTQRYGLSLTAGYQMSNITIKLNDAHDNKVKGYFNNANVVNLEIADNTGLP